MTPARIAILFILSQPLAASAHENKTTVSQQADLTCIASNGVPDHDMGRFPNRANPNTFSEQNLQFCFPNEPKLTDTVTEGLMTVGVSVTGAPIRPYTAGYYDPIGRRGIGHDPSSGWRQQAMHEPRSLGMDTQNGHVDRSGLYHYHAVSLDLMDGQDSTLLGYAPDGYEIRYSPSTAMSSWQLRSGTRATPPHGAFDGRFEEDFEYDAGSGTLDECNGGMVNGTYTYFATDSYPYFPRCFKGEVNARFMVRG